MIQKIMLVLCVVIIALLLYLIKKTSTNPKGETIKDAEEYYKLLEKNVKEIRKTTDFVPDIAIVLGSGLGNFADNIEVVAEVPYSKLSNFPVATNSGHEGKFIFGKIGNVNVVCSKGRIHYYEGYSMQQVTTPLRLMYLLGAKTVILTNAAGAINKDYNIGDFVSCYDFITNNLPSPVAGAVSNKFGERFFDMTYICDKDMIEKLHTVAEKNNIPLHDGIYVQTAGPQFETPVEIKSYGDMGADVVGMSTACEAIVARQMSMKICCISFVSNMAAGITGEALSDEEVGENAQKYSESFKTLLVELLKAL